MTKKDYFIPRMFYRLLMPSLVSSVGYALADMVDAVVVGRQMGETGLAAISLSLPLYMLINLFMDALALGGSVYFSQKIGEGEASAARACFGRIWTATLAVGLVIAALVNVFPYQMLALLGTTPADGKVFYACGSYVRIIAAGAPLLMLNIVLGTFLRNDGKAALASVGFLIGNALDIALNVVFVMLCALGTRGAALATVCGSAVTVTIYVVGILRDPGKALCFERVQIKVSETLSCFRIGFSTSVRHLLSLVFLLAVNRTLMSMSGESGVAIFDVVYNASFFLIYLFNGTGEALQPLVSTFTGEKSEADSRYVLSLAERTALMVGAAAALLMALFAPGIASLFGVSEELQPLAARAVRLYVLGFAFAGVNILREQYEQARDNTLAAFMLVLLREMVVLLPCMLAFSQLGLSYMWLFYPASECVTFVAFRVLMHFLPPKPTFPPERSLRITVENAKEDIADALVAIECFCTSHEATPAQTCGVSLVTEELCMSIFRNAMTGVKDAKIRLTLLAIEDGSFVLHSLDNAVPFDPFSRAFRTNAPEDAFDIDAASLAIIRSRAKKTQYRPSVGFNSFVIQL